MPPDKTNTTRRDILDSSNQNKPDVRPLGRGMLTKAEEYQKEQRTGPSATEQVAHLAQKLDKLSLKDVLQQMRTAEDQHLKIDTDTKDTTVDRSSENSRGDLNEWVERGLNIGKYFYDKALKNSSVSPKKFLTMGIVFATWQAHQVNALEFNPTVYQIGGRADGTHCYLPESSLSDAHQFDRFYENFASRIIKHLDQVFEPIVQELAADPSDPSLSPINLHIDHTSDSPGVAVNTEFLVFNPDKVGGEHGEVEGLSTHEITHLLQIYPDEPENAHAIFEGIADLMRDKYGPKDDHWSLPFLKPEHHYKDGYGVTAGFLKWGAEVYGEDFVKRPHSALQKQRFTWNVFRDVTGKPVELLWQEYQSSEFTTKIHGNGWSMDSTLHIENISKREGDTIYLAEPDRKPANRARKQFNKVFPSIVQELAPDLPDPDLSSITLRFDRNLTGQMQFNSQDKTIDLNPDLLKQPDQIEQEITYASTHLLQDYPSQPEDAQAVIDGMAQYMTNKHGPKNDKSSLPPLQPEDHYTDSKEMMARLLGWVQEHKSQTIIKDLHHKLREGEFTWKVLEDLTGQTADQLWQEYSGKQQWKYWSTVVKKHIMSTGLGLAIASAMGVAGAAIGNRYTSAENEVPRPDQPIEATRAEVDRLRHREAAIVTEVTQTEVNRTRRRAAVAAEKKIRQHIENKEV